MAKLLPNWKLSDLNTLKPFSDVELIAFDIDGTLESKTLSVYDTLLAQNRKLQKKVGVVIATGRTFFGARSMLDKWKVSDQLPLILYNGSVILRPSSFEVLRRKMIPISSLNNILSITKKNNVRTLAYFISLPFELTGFLETKEWVIGWYGKNKTKKEFNQMEIEWSEANEYPIDHMSPTAILLQFIGTDIDKEKLMSEISKVPDITVTSSNGDYIEVRPIGSDKGVALSEVAELLNVKSKAVLALGDGDNDFEMLQWSGIGVAVKGASNLAIDASDYVCNHAAAEGAVEVLRLVVEAKRFFSD